MGGLKEAIFGETGGELVGQASEGGFHQVIFIKPILHEAYSYRATYHPRKGGFSGLSEGLKSRHILMLSTCTDRGAGP